MVAAAALAAACSCKDAAIGNPPGLPQTAPNSNAAERAPDRGEFVRPPFAVRGDARDLLLVWFDAEGAHTAASRQDIPAEHRSEVRVDSLALAPEDRLDPDYVFIADLTADGDVDHPVRKVRRSVFDMLVAGGRDHETGAGNPSAGTADVIMYGASWCDACDTAAAFFRSRGIAFVERDVERDPAALAEMQQKVRAAGLHPTGVPIIDFGGTILEGFDQARLEQLIGAGRRVL